jgi:amidase
VLAEHCAHVDEVLPPRIEEAYDLTLRYWRRPESASPDEWVADGPPQLSSEEVERHLFEWDRFRRVLLGFMADYDVILTPTAAPAAFGAWGTTG